MFPVSGLSANAVLPRVTPLCPGCDGSHVGLLLFYVLHAKCVWASVDSLMEPFVNPGTVGKRFDSDPLTKTIIFFFDFQLWITAPILHINSTSITANSSNSLKFAKIAAPINSKTTMGFHWHSNLPQYIFYLNICFECGNFT